MLGNRSNYEKKKPRLLDNTPDLFALRIRLQVMKSGLRRKLFFLEHILSYRSSQTPSLNQPTWNGNNKGW